jgi:hypothetical protein
MKKNAKIFLSKTLGDDFLESLGTSLSKSEVYKQGTRTVTDTNDLFQGLQIVPRALLGLLVRELSPMQIGDTKEIKIPGKEDTIIITTKHERDSYSGQVLQNNVKINDFLHRSVPGLGLVLMTMLELYDVDGFEEAPASKVNESEINRIIDERLNLHSLINKVVDGKMMQRDAVQQLLMAKLNEEIVKEKKKNKDIAEVRAMQEKSTPQSDEYFRGMTNGLEVANTIANEKEPEFVEHSKVIPLVPKKSRPLSEFVENRKKKLNKKEFSIEMKKGESFDCPDCGNLIFNESGFSSCICFGDVGKVYLKKSEDGFKVSFSKSWDADNIEMLLEVLRGKKNEKL